MAGAELHASRLARRPRVEINNKINRTAIRAASPDVTMYALCVPCGWGLHKIPKTVEEA